MDEPKDESMESPIHALIPGSALGMIWLIYLLVHFVFYMYRSSSAEKWSKPYFYRCNSKSARYTYVVRLIVQTPASLEEMSDCSMDVVLMANNDQTALVDLIIDSQRFQTISPFSEEEPNKSVVRLLLHTIFSLNSMETVVLNMRSGAQLKVFNVEFQDINDITSEANVAQVGQDIRRVGPTKALEKQSFPILAKRYRDMEENVVSSRLLTMSEYFLFIWMAFNLIGLFATFLRICTGDEILCEDFNLDFLSSGYTGGVASCLTVVVFVVLIVIYRYVIKYKLEKSLDSSFWKYIRCLYLSVILAIGGGSALAVTIFVPKHSHRVHHYTRGIDVSVFWIAALLIGIAIFVIFWLSLLSILANCFNFFIRTIDDRIVPVPYEDPKPPTESPPKIKISPKSYKSPKSAIKSPISPKKTDNKTDDEQESDNYYKELMKSGPKVKSISQYGKTASPKPPANEDQTEGDNYLKELAKKFGNVASISQYGKKK